jgi:exodeoxyribonuclease VII large subunit
VLAGIGHEVDFTLADMTADARAATPTHAAQMLWPARGELERRLRSLAADLNRIGALSLARREERLERLERDLAWRSPQRSLAAWGERLRAALRLLDAALRRNLERSENRLRSLAAAVARAPDRLPPRQAALDALDGRLRRFGLQFPSQAENRLERLALRLEALDPRAPLERGYALARKTDGTFVRSPAMVQADELLRLTVRDGDIPVRVRREKP